jgi:hypothetical protein|eukprot:SAG25_NODE_156_length_13498_cov_313.643406_3_plen_205_part_00
MTRLALVWPAGPRRLAPPRRDGAHRSVLALASCTAGEAEAERQARRGAEAQLAAAQKAEGEAAAERCTPCCLLPAACPGYLSAGRPVDDDTGVPPRRCHGAGGDARRGGARGGAGGQGGGGESFLRVHWVAVPEVSRARRVNRRRRSGGPRPARSPSGSSSSPRITAGRGWRRRRGRRRRRRRTRTRTRWRRHESGGGSSRRRG